MSAILTGRAALPGAHLQHLGAGAIRRARRSGRPVLGSLTIRLDGAVDPAAVAWASRAGDEHVACFEQPDRDGFALAGLGSARELTARGPDRFAAVAAEWRELAADAVRTGEPGVPGAGLVALGGFAFAGEGAAAPEWEGFAPASLTVPEVALARRDGTTWLTLSALVAPDDLPDDVARRLAARRDALRSTRLALLDPAPVAHARIVSALPPEHYEAAVAGAVQRIRADGLEKIVLAREVQVHAAAVHDPGAVFGVLRDAFPSCYVYAVARGDATFLGASPELLARREGQRASTVALAGSARRSADPAVDDHLGERLMRSDKEREEQAIVVRRIEHALRPHAVWVTAAPEPVVVRVANVQHLATPIRAQLARPVGAVELAGVLHPTPAVGGEPLRAAAPLIPALEGLDRGWYAGPLGWTDATGDGELCVALRCALLRGKVARCYAGVGVVRDSDPAAELAETEIKLQALLPVLAA